MLKNWGDSPSEKHLNNHSEKKAVLKFIDKIIILTARNTLQTLLVSVPSCQQKQSGVDTPFLFYFAVQLHFSITL